MCRIEKRIQLRLFGQGDEVPDQHALVETRLIRHVNDPFLKEGACKSSS